ncbi:MAG: glycosyltransferase family 4 protein [Bacteroidetes bacterium]|jgi:glycosyltransferase involved in cell wall biosynthesis|nr:glycosyltransferase family 4 protein [Bacteroidota bacterium]MBT6685297.1 glycosyltransferase family 4 protein [Bacteroidota bacterium]MBT7141744.1 glycosyltransferase family 4 protein [Bacteroidota bacterium]MBT7491442.1 glycosyltransferase family 4 protein [Bacteroidota bacterium]
MKIGFDAKRAFFNKSGLGNYSRSTISLLQKYFPEIEYFLYTPSLKTAVSFNLNNSTKIVSPKYLNKISPSFWRTFNLSKQIEKDEIEIYHGLSNELPKNIAKTKTKSIVTIHDLIFLRYPEFYSKIDRKIYLKKFRHACLEADKVLAISKQTKNDIENFLEIDKSKIEVVYQTCDSSFAIEKMEVEKSEIRRKYNLPENYLLYVGTIEERKNLLTIVKALHLGKIDIPLIVIGKSTEYLKKVLSYISENNMKNINILKNVDFVDFPAIYQMAEIFIYPSVFEGFGIPIIEALYSKTPVITTKGGCFNETGGQNSLYISPYNVSEMTEAINRILYDTNLQKTIAASGFEFVQKFNEDIVASNIFSLYQKLLS